MDYAERVLVPLGFTLTTELGMVDREWVEPDVESDVEYDSDSEYETVYLYDGAGTEDDPIVIDDDDD